MKPKCLQNKNSEFRIGDKVWYTDLNGRNKKADIVDFVMEKEYIAKLSDGGSVHTDYLTLIYDSKD